jgi:hypothetical protein
VKEKRALMLLQLILLWQNLLNELKSHSKQNFQKISILKEVEEFFKKKI